MKKQNEKASVLIMTIGILAILSAMAATFVTLMRLEAHIAANKTDNIQADLIAKACLEYTIALLIEDDENGGAIDNYKDDKWFSAITAGTGGLCSDLDNGLSAPKWIPFKDGAGVTIGRFAFNIIDQAGRIYINENATTGNTHIDSMADATATNTINFTNAPPRAYVPDQKVAAGVPNTNSKFLYAVYAYVNDSGRGVLNLNTLSYLHNKIGGSNTDYTTSVFGKMWASTLSTTTYLATVAGGIYTNSMIINAIQKSTINDNNYKMTRATLENAVIMLYHNGIIQANDDADTEKILNYTLNTLNWSEAGIYTDGTSGDYYDIKLNAPGIAPTKNGGTTSGNYTKLDESDTTPLCFKSGVFEINGIGQFTNSTHTKIYASKRFKAIVDRSQNPVKILYFNIKNKFATVQSGI